MRIMYENIKLDKLNDLATIIFVGINGYQSEVLKIFKTLEFFLVQVLNQMLLLIFTSSTWSKVNHYFANFLIHYVIDIIQH